MQVSRESLDVAGERRYTTERTERGEQLKDFSLCVEATFGM